MCNSTATYYNEHRSDAEFMTILNFIRRNCLASEDEVVDGTNLEREVVSKHHRFAQAMVAEEIGEGKILDPEGAAVAEGFMEYLRSL